MAPHRTTHARLYRARLARAVAGAALILTAIAMVAAAADRGSLPVLVVGWGISAVLLLLVRLWPAPEDAEAAAVRLASWGLRLPMIGLSLVMPLTLHGLFLLLTGELDDRGFSKWVGISAIVVGQAHLALAWLSQKDAARMAAGEAEVGWKWSSWVVLWKTTLASCIPSILLMMVPPILTFLTGAAFIPAMYFAAHRISAWERVCTDWLVLAERTGLSIDPLSGPRLPLLTGTVDGCRVVLRGQRRWRGDAVFNLEVGLATTELLHLQISTDLADPGTIKLGEPVADAVLRISSSGSTDTSALAARIRDPDCYAALMEVVHGRGGRIRGGRIRLKTSAENLTPVWEALPLMIDLARQLRQPALQEPIALTPRPVCQASPAG